jgi:hypothetical protein
MRRSVFHTVVAAVICLTLSSGAWRPAWADPDGDSEFVDQFDADFKRALLGGAG